MTDDKLIKDFSRDLHLDFSTKIRDFCNQHDFSLDHVALRICTEILVSLAVAIAKTRSIPDDVFKESLLDMISSEFDRLSEFRMPSTH